jgi:two-component sensor histidine kinase
MSTDRAVLVALLVGELVTNAAKHAYSAGAPGPIFVHLARTGNASVTVSVRDEGKGLPHEADVKREGLGMKMIDAFVKQSGATLDIRRPAVGTEFVVEVPLH